MVSCSNPSANMAFCLYSRYLLKLVKSKRMHIDLYHRALTKKEKNKCAEYDVKPIKVTCLVLTRPHCTNRIDYTLKGNVLPVMLKLDFSFAT